MEYKLLEYKNDIFKNVDELINYFHLSKESYRKLIYLKGITINEKPCEKGAVLSKGDLIKIDEGIVKKNNYFPYKENIEVLYEDDDILIVYKKRGILVHPDGNNNDTLVNMVKNYYNSLHSVVYFEHLHRIDVDTYGMVLFSKNILAHSFISNLIENHEVKKVYYCVCEGILGAKQGIIDKPIGNNRHNNLSVVTKSGKDAITKYRVIKELDSKSLLEVEIDGGRKHQIRCHLAYINHPIIGDKLYGKKDSEELKLKFCEVSFVHPRTHKMFEFKIDWKDLYE